LLIRDFDSPLEALEAAGWPSIATIDRLENANQVICSQVPNRRKPLQMLASRRHACRWGNAWVSIWVMKPCQMMLPTGQLGPRATQLMSAKGRPLSTVEPSDHPKQHADWR
jgi:hypothetical protein